MEKLSKLDDFALICSLKLAAKSVTLSATVFRDSAIV
jgi:hypothetical protein